MPRYLFNARLKHIPLLKPPVIPRTPEYIGPIGPAFLRFSDLRWETNATAHGRRYKQATKKDFVLKDSGIPGAGGGLWRKDTIPGPSMAQAEAPDNVIVEYLPCAGERITVAQLKELYARGGGRCVFDIADLDAERPYIDGTWSVHTFQFVEVLVEMRTHYSGVGCQCRRNRTDVYVIMYMFIRLGLQSNRNIDTCYCMYILRRVSA